MLQMGMVSLAHGTLSAVSGYRASGRSLHRSSPWVTSIVFAFYPNGAETELSCEGKHKREIAKVEICVNHVQIEVPGQHDATDGDGIDDFLCYCR